MQQTTTTTRATPDDRAMGFEAVEGGGDTTSGATLLVVAYIIMWALLVGFILLSWRRIGRVEARFGGLERALESGSATEK